MNIVILGAGGHARETLQAARRVDGSDPRSPRVTVDGLHADTEPDFALLSRVNTRWLGPVATASAPALIGVGSGQIKAKLSPMVDAAPAVIDPLALVGDDVELADGVVVFAQATVTTNIQLGMHVHIGRGAAVGHDSVIDDFASVMPLASISGDVRIGPRAFIGTGAVVRQGVTVGADAVVGMGAVVVKDVPAGATVVGNPARVIRS